MPGSCFKIVGRVDDMLIVKGVSVHPQAVKNLIDEFHPCVPSAIRILPDRPGPLVTPPLRVRLEHGAGTDTSQRAALEGEMLTRFRQELGITPPLPWVAPRAIPREAMRARHVEVERRRLRH